MFGSALPKLVSLFTPLIVPAQVMSTSPSAVWKPKPTPAVVAEKAAPAKPVAPVRPDERDLASLAIRLPGELAAAVIPSAKTSAAVKVEEKKPAEAPIAMASGDEPWMGLHVTGWVALLPKRMGEMLDFVDKSQMNAIMVCVKDEAGIRFWKMKTPGMKGSHCFSELIEKCKAKGIRTAVRFVCFKDAAMEKANPGMRFSEERGERRLPPWTDPTSPETLKVTLAELEEVAKLGFDEINLDYVRFPDRIRMNTSLAKKCDAISDFIRKAREVVKPYNVRLTASVFGYVAWDEKKANVGQRIEDIYQHLDGVYFMVYPSHFAKGDLGFKDPSARPYEVVRLGMEAAKRHFEKAPSIDILPWIQVFSLKNDHRYGAKEVLLQLRGNVDAGIEGYWAWDPGVEYNALKEALPILAKHGYPAANTAYFEEKAKKKAAEAQKAELAAKSETTEKTQKTGAVVKEAIKTVAKAISKPKSAAKTPTMAKATKPAGDDAMYSY